MWGLRKKIDFSLYVIESALARFKRTAAFFSGGKDSLVMTHLILRVCSGSYDCPLFILGDPVPISVNVEYLKRMVKRLGIEDYVFYSDLLTEEDYRNAGRIAADKVRCCLALKVEPVKRLIRDYGLEAIFVGIRWDEHPERANENYFSQRDNPPHVRVHPLLHWTWFDIWKYIRDEGLEPNPLYFRGYTSLGCAPCTARATDREFGSVDEIIEFISKGDVAERSGRDIDKERVMERLRKLGYF